MAILRTPAPKVEKKEDPKKEDSDDVAMDMPDLEKNATPENAEMKDETPA